MLKKVKKKESILRELTMRVLALDIHKSKIII